MGALRDLLDEKNIEISNLKQEVKSLKRQLMVAKDCLKIYANPNNWDDFTGLCESNGEPFHFVRGYFKEDGFCYAQCTLDDLKVLVK